MTCSPAMPGKSCLGPFKSSCNEYFLFFLVLFRYRIYGSHGLMWIHVSHFTGTQRIFAFRHKQPDNICPFRNASVFETKDVRHGEWVSGLPCGVGTKQFPSPWPHSVAS